MPAELRQFQLCRHADLYADPEGWHPHPDDLDIPDEDRQSLRAAFELLGVKTEVARNNPLSKSNR